MVSLFHGKALKSAVSLMAVLVLFVATLGIPLSQHLCGGQVYSQSFYGAAQPCSMQSEPSPSGAEHLGQAPCCANQHELQAASGLENDGPRALPISPELALDLGFRVQALAYMPDSPKSLYPLGYTGPPLPGKDVVLEFRVLLI